MIKNKLPLLIFILIFAISFSIPSIFLFSSISDHKTAQEIVKTGTKTNATPTDYGTNLTINDIPYYYITYEFKVDGVTYFGKTSPKYKSNEYYYVFKQGYIEIAYNENFESIESDYTLTSALKTEFIMLGIFGVVDLCFWIAVIVFIVKIIKNGILNLLGKRAEATFISMKPGIIVNNVPMYRVSYCWRNNLGEICEGITDSDYTLTQARAFEIAGKFDILYHKTISKIVSKPNKLFFQQAENEHLVETDYFVCDYCGSMSKTTSLRCSSCGAPQKNTSKKIKIN